MSLLSWSTMSIGLKLTRWAARVASRPVCSAEIRGLVNRQRHLHYALVKCFESWNIFWTKVGLYSIRRRRGLSVMCLPGHHIPVRGKKKKKSSKLAWRPLCLFFFQGKVCLEERQDVTNERCPESSAHGYLMNWLAIPFLHLKPTKVADWAWITVFECAPLRVSLLKNPGMKHNKQRRPPRSPDARRV